MTLETTVGPPKPAINQGHGVLITDPDGQIPWPSDKGLSRIFLTNGAFSTEAGSILPRTLGLVLSRSISGGIHEDLDLVNNSMKPVRFNLETAQTLRAKAKALFNNFNETFWDEDTGFYAYALDGDKKKVLTVASARPRLL
jgi:hypothetical protein